MGDLRVPSAIAALLVLAAPARAGGLNDHACKLSSAHPHPVVLVHGQGATVEMFEDLDLVTTLVAQGHCVYGVSHGQNESGPSALSRTHG